MLYPMGNPIGILIAGEAPSSLLFKHCLLTPGVLPNSWNGKYSPIGNIIKGWHLDLNILTIVEDHLLLFQASIYLS